MTNLLWPIWMSIAEKEIGIKELQGHEDNPRIIEYHSHTKLGAKHDIVPWCSSFVCFCLETSGHESTQNALARSYLDYGVSIQPCYGAILVLNIGRHEWQSHVGFYLYQDQHRYYVLGGNQRDSVCVSSYAKELLIDARYPVENIIPSE